MDAYPVLYGPTGYGIHDGESEFFVPPYSILQKIPRRSLVVDHE